MTANLILKATLIWFGIAALAVVNGVVRENVFVPKLGMKFALPLSGITLSIIIFVVTYLSFNFLDAKQKTSCIFIGIQWGLMTLVFEFLFGHFFAHKSWSDLVQIFNIAKGDFFTLALIVTILSPYLTAKLRGIF